MEHFCLSLQLEASCVNQPLLICFIHPSFSPSFFHSPCFLHFHALEGVQRNICGLGHYLPDTHRSSRRRKRRGKDKTRDQCNLLDREERKVCGGRERGKERRGAGSRKPQVCAGWRVGGHRERTEKKWDCGGERQGEAARGPGGRKPSQICWWHQVRVVGWNPSKLPSRICSVARMQTVLVQANENKERWTTPNPKTNPIKLLTDQANSYTSGKTVIMTVHWRLCVAIQAAWVNYSSLSLKSDYFATLAPLYSEE